MKSSLVCDQPAAAVVNVVVSYVEGGLGFWMKSA
jgi:hypothetical protein